MVKRYKELIKKYFEEHNFIESNITSFNNFIEKEIQNIVDNTGDIIPTIIPTDVQDYRIKFGKISVGKPQIIEADGSKRDVYPIEARLRKLTYSAPIFLDISAHVDNIQRESFNIQIGKIPVMVKSKSCNLDGLSKEELVLHGEDANDTGGYFILNGNERVLITVEDLVSNKLFVSKTKIGPAVYTGSIFSEYGSYRIPHQIEQMRDGVIYLSFTRYKRIPFVVILKALGLEKDQEITNSISDKKQYDDIFINLYECLDVKSQSDAIDHLGKKAGIVQPKEQLDERIKADLDKYLLPHLGTTPKDRLNKAYNLCKLIKKFLMVSRDGLPTEDKDHYMNKRLKLSGDLLADLFRTNLRVLVNDILYNFQRLVKRGKFQSIKIIIRDKLITSRIKSAMATGSWPGERKGISQNIDRTNFLSTSSHLQRVVSLLSASQENFEARELHSTHWGRLCPIETPEGTPIGLRKNLALLCKVSQDKTNEEKIKKSLEDLGVKLNKK